MTARKKLRSPRESGDSPRIFFNDGLNRAKDKLLSKARTLVKSRAYRMAWVKNTEVFSKKDNGYSLIRIACVADDAKIVWTMTATCFFCPNFKFLQDNINYTCALFSCVYKSICSLRTSWDEFRILLHTLNHLNVYVLTEIIIAP